MDQVDLPPTKATCPECGEEFSVKNGGHCRGGGYGGCCRTFSSDRTFTAHRKGPYGQRWCLDVRQSYKWRLGRLGWTNEKQMDSSVYEVFGTAPKRP